MEATLTDCSQKAIVVSRAASSMDKDRSLGKYCGTRALHREGSDEGGSNNMP